MEECGYYVGEFKKFIMRGMCLTWAIGVIIGGAFGAIVQSLVKDIIMPPIGLLLGKVDFTNLFINIRRKVRLWLLHRRCYDQLWPSLTRSINLPDPAFVIFLVVKQATSLRPQSPLPNSPPSSVPTASRSPQGSNALPQPHFSQL